MPLMEMPNGEYVDIADGTPPEVVNRIKSNYAPKRSTVPAPRVTQQTSFKATPETKSDRWAKTGQGRTTYDGGDALLSAATFGLSDKAVAGVQAGIDKLTGRASDGFVAAYNDRMARRKQEEADYETEHPWKSAISTGVGMFLNPVGAETGAGKVFTKVAPKAKAAIDASRAGRIAAYLGNSSIGLGARAGFNQGVISGALNGGSEDRVGDALHEGLINAGAGAALGGAFGAAGKAYSAWAARSPENASRVAYEKVADMLGRATNKTTGNKYTPLTAINEMKAAAHQGSDPALMDLSPEMRGWAAGLSRKPGLEASSALDDMAVARGEAASDRFDNKIRSIFQPRTDAVTRKAEIQAGRKAQAAKDYTPEVMDRQFTWNDDLENYFAKDNPLVKGALKRATEIAKNEDIDPKQLGYVFDEAGDIKFTKVPSMAVFDRMKKGYDSMIGEAMRAGDRDTARIISKQLGQLKDGIARSNPEYSDILARQRDYFQQQNSVELGQEFLKGVRQDARGYLSKMRNNGINKDDLRLGVADALLHMRESTDSPIKLMRRFMRSDDQRKALQYVFGSNKTLNEFDRFMRRELRAAKTDAKVGHDGNSVTSLANNYGEAADDMGGFLDTAKSVVQGAAFGGPLGALSRGMRSIDMLGRGLGPKAQEELARILMGRGEGLQKGVDNATRYAARREAARKRRAVIAGKEAAAFVGGAAQE